MTWDSGDVAFMIVCTGLVQFMTPGLAFFYSGLVREKTMLTMVAQNFVSLGLTTLLWATFLFSLCFGPHADRWGILGDPATFAFMRNVSPVVGLDLGQANGVVSEIPGLLFAAFQLKFAVITPALMTGAFADRFRFMPWLIFLCVWLIVVYAPWCHLIWGDGALSQWGVVDFAGGIVIHTTAGFSALAAVAFLGRRPHGVHDDPHHVHSVPLVFLGTAMLWFGWFGFNAGSAEAADSVATVALWNTQIAASSAMIVWGALDWYKRGKPSVVSACVGAVAGLATITPAAGYIQPSAALLLGLLAAPVCMSCVHFLEYTHFDDALDVWGVHGMGGAFGAIMVGLMADGPECADASVHPDWCVNPGTITRSGTAFSRQLCAVCLCALFSMAATLLILALLSRVVVLSPDHHELMDLDHHTFEEAAYKSPHYLNADRLKEALLDTEERFHMQHDGSDSSTHAEESTAIPKTSSLSPTLSPDDRFGPEHERLVQTAAQLMNGQLNGTTSIFVGGTHTHYPAGVV
uniref:Ammonium transporter n=1 Tax=Noctiluca scintillans TaxID=2966 RepID=A0A7S1AXZ5_NOCSC|eukprot:CAMPEP_0194512026 /NCGR_PEP_ID=MMETSP0253-20130528/43868_1 /TAXON_ID=2966 /ORGANISM="Noctiluca scintillans" /LENGTH=518 /DNA_ID=CAMNT_0039355423 /DNA_START=26 /DNA_END=1582 /DNA_ORIENTATION=+